MKNLKDERREYNQKFLTSDSLTEQPTELFTTWLGEAMKNEKDPTAMVLSTSINGQPSSRVVLLKEVKDQEFVFFTNYASKKGREIEANNQVALNFYWQNCERQVRIQGVAKKISPDESKEYFDSRPYESRVGAIVSKQSDVLTNREELASKFKEALKAANEIERPENWGGFSVQIEEIEFWQGRPSRLHDRYRYKRNGINWDIDRLYP